VIAQRELLLLADDALGREFEVNLGPGRMVQRTDPYDALAEMSRRRWRSVVLTAPWGDFAGLCRASRRLQHAARLLAVCEPVCEPQLRTLVGRELDDYFIYPPTRADWQALRRAAGIEAQPAAPPPEGPARALAPADVSGLVVAARSTATLEAHLAATLSEAAGTTVAWVDEPAAGAAAEPVLRLPGQPARVLVPRGGGRIGPAALRRAKGVQELLGALVDSARRTEALHQLAITDHLTGAYNRRYFYFVTDQILLRARQRRPHVTLLLFDIDNFKRYNDAYGHAAGDEILRQTTEMMRRITREQDIVARIGGDEFAVLFWDDEPRKPDSQPPDTAFALADRFRTMVETHEFPSLGPEAKGVLTISGGLATFPTDGRTCRELLRRADRALKEAKLSGKNGIHLIGRAPNNAR
jgi:diguanylate cyclase (GGDEF)-like protein